jgi:hypothetical protein
MATTEPPDLLVTPELKAMTEIRVYKVYKELRESMAMMEPQEALVLRATKVSKV